ncbi:MAG TPA: hypothetical protein VE465_01970 [Streptosporangiaceae bacterium]|jgi:hypothetical protein|nr:hypothetical protein [Streptosporangiaceae bacterium]
MTAFTPRPPDGASPEMYRKAYELVIDAVEKIRGRATKAGLAAVEANKEGNMVHGVFESARENAHRIDADLVIEALVDAFELWEDYAAASAEEAPATAFLGPMPVAHTRNHVHKAIYVLNASAARLTHDQQALLGIDVPVELEQLSLMCSHPDVWGPDGLVRAGQAVVQAMTLKPEDAPESVASVMGDVLRLRAYLRALDAAHLKAQS